MRRIVFLLPDAAGIDPTEIVAGVPRDEFTTTIVGFGGGLPALLRSGRDARALRPDVLHAVGPAAVRLASALRLSGLRPPLVVSDADRPEPGPLGWFTRPCLRAADRVIARTQAEAARYRVLGVVPERLAVVPFGVASTTPSDPIAFRRSLNIPDDARLILAAGGFDSAAALKDAAWAFDVLKYVAPDLHLVLVGDGPERRRVEAFAHAIGFDDYRVHFAGPRADRPSLFALADVVWVTHRRGGVKIALEAMAAGAPVVAVGTPDLAEVVSGILVPPGDRVRMAAVTAELLADPDRAAVLGAAAHTVAGRFSVAAMAARYAAVYHDVVKSS